MVPARKLATNTTIQIIGRILTLVISVVTLSFIANHLFVDGSALKGYGQYSIVLIYISIIGATADLGLFTLVVREISGAKPEAAGRIVGSAIAFRFLLFLATLLILLAIFPFLPYEPIVKQGIVLGAITAFLMLFSQAIAAIFQANYQAEKIVVAEVIGRLVMAALTIYFLRQGLGLLPVIAANVIGNVALLLASYLLSRSTAPIKISFDFSFWRQSLPQFWSIAAVTVLGLIHFRLDSLILSFYQPVTEVGIYGVAYRVLDIVLVIPAIFAANLLPLLTKLADSGNKEGMAAQITRSTGTLFAISVTIGAVLITLAPWIITFITQAEFAASAVPLRLLVPAFIFLFITSLYAQTAIALKEQQRLIGGYAIVIGLDIVLNLILIPRFSYIGAATTTVLSEGILMVYSLWLLTKLLPLRLTQLPWGKMIGFGVALAAVTVAAYQLVLSLTGQFEVSNKLIQGSWIAGIGGALLLAAFGLFVLIFKRQSIVVEAQV